MSIAIEANNLVKKYGEVTALDGLSLQVEEGTVFGLLGPNGAGKTTFVNIITGYVKPDSGDIEFTGQPITAMTPRQITRLGVARSFQIPQLYASLSVLDNVLVAQACHDDRLSLWRTARTTQAIARAEQVLTRFRLQDQRHRLVAELPGGMRKLLDIALAMTGQPS